MSRKPSVLLTRRTTVLAAAGVFDSAWVQTRLHPIPATATTIPQYFDYKRVRGFVVADQASAANGFQVQFANADNQSDSWAAFSAGLAINTAQSFDVLLQGAKYVRIELTNGAVVQGLLSLVAYLEDD